MDFNQIKFFLNLADTLNFTRAAQISNVSQPALTKAIQRLEHEFGGQLIYRDGRDTRLTELGRILRAEFEAIAICETRARELADLVVKEKRTMMTIGIASALPPYPVWSCIEDFLSREENAEVEFVTVASNSVRELLLSGALDACFCADFVLDNPKLHSLFLYAERLMVAVDKSHPFSELDIVPLQDLRHQNLIDHLDCPIRAAFVNHFKDNKVLRRPIMQSDRIDWIQVAISRGVGISIIPETTRLNEDIVLKPISGSPITRKIELVSVFGSATPSAIRRLVDAAREYAWPVLKI